MYIHDQTIHPAECSTTKAAMKGRTSVNLTCGPQEHTIIPRADPTYVQRSKYLLTAQSKFEPIDNMVHTGYCNKMCKYPGNEEWVMTQKERSSIQSISSITFPGQSSYYPSSIYMHGAQRSKSPYYCHCIKGCMCHVLRQRTIVFCLTHTRPQLFPEKTHTNAHFHFFQQQTSIKIDAFLTMGICNLKKKTHECREWLPIQENRAPRPPYNSSRHNDIPSSHNEPPRRVVLPYPTAKDRKAASSSSEST